MLAFYTGMSSPLLGSALSEALQFTMISKMKHLISERKGVEVDSLRNKDILKATLATGLVNSFLLTPIEHIKVQMQVQRKFVAENCKH